MRFLAMNTLVLVKNRKHMNRYLLTLSLILVFSSCTFTKMGSIDWIVGTWKSPKPNHNEGETWQKTADGYLGKAWSVQAGDTIFSENMRIFQEGDSLFLEVVHPTETNGLPIIFKELDNSSRKFSFEKRDHDWPHFISYWKEGEKLKAHVGSYTLGEAELWFEWERIE